MKKAIILGNGFDLRHYLPTRYSHLINVLKEIEDYHFSDSDVFFHDIFDGIFKENDERFYEKIHNYYEVDKIKFNSEKLKSIQKRIKKNSWFKYLKTVEESKIDTWIDFETEINRVLQFVIDFFKEFNNDQLYRQKFETSAYFYLQNFDYKKIFKNKVQYNILTNFKLFIIDEDITMANSDFYLNIDNELQYFNERDFFNSLYYSLEEFIGIFNDYLVLIVQPFYDCFNEEKKENFLIRNTKNANGRDIKQTLFNKVDVYSFNYTPSLEKLYNKRNIHFLHGKINENWTKEEDLSIVMGIDDLKENGMKELKLFQFTKYFQKLHKNTDYFFLNKIIENYKNENSEYNYIIYFWGHSLDISDKDYILEVFQSLKLRKENIIKIFYHSISGKADQLKNLLGIIDKNIIEDLMKKNRLIFLESNLENLFQELA